MPKRVEYLEDARVDFDESFTWYEQRSQAAAFGFVLAMDEAIASILEDPHRFPRTHGECRYYKLRRFPFRVVFRDETERLVIVAIAHAKRHPDYWRRRR